MLIIWLNESVLNIYFEDFFSVSEDVIGILIQLMNNFEAIRFCFWEHGVLFIWVMIVE